MEITPHLTRVIAEEQMINLGLNIQLESDQKIFLLQLCEEAKKFSFAPYSNFNVGAAAWLANGDIVLGANLELSDDLTNSIHAEQSLLVQAQHFGQDILKIAVNHPPCGFCRQSLMELHNGPNIQIFFGTAQATLSQLLPLPFGPSDLGQTALPPHYPKWNITEDDELNIAPKLCRQQLRDHLAASYAPRTNSPAAVALETIDHKIFYGRYFENAAFNPTISAIRSAFVIMTHHGYNPEDPIDDYITKVWLAYNESSVIDHTVQTREFLTSRGYSTEKEIIPLAISINTAPTPTATLRSILHPKCRLRP